jgi:hypothetical protein
MSATRSNPTSNTSSSSLTSGTTTATTTIIDADSLLASTLLRIRTDDSLAANLASHQNPRRNKNSAPPTTTAPTGAGEAKRVSPIILLAPRPSNNNNTQDQSAMIPSTGAARGQQQQQSMPFPNGPNAAVTTNMLNNSSAGMFGMNHNGRNNHNAYRGSSSDHHGGVGIALEQINALQALAANRAASLAATGAATASNSPLRRHNTAHFAAAAPSPRGGGPLGQFDHHLQQASSQHLTASSPPTTTTSSSQAGQQVVLASRTPSVRQQLAAEVALQMSEHYNNESTLAAAAAAAEAAAMVRKEQVEAALRSAPQRGRKREDLSELERMELTRTRNREHARSTRIRKKARYQELLDCEQQLDHVVQQENVQQKRRSVILEFLALRRSMLLSVLGDNRPEVGGPQVASTSSNKSLNDLVEDPDQFCVRFNDFNRPATALTLNSSSSSSALYMKNFDLHLVRRVVGTFGKTALRGVCYSVQGSGGSNSNMNSAEASSWIALDLAHGGFANVEISLIRPPNKNEENNNNKVLLMTGVMQFDFSDKNSDKLRSVVWSTMRDFTNDLLSSNNNNNDDDGLNAQVSHPSVVSLDQSAAMSLFIQESASSLSGSSSDEATNKPSLSSSSSPQERQQLEEGGGGDCGGPGMNI